MLVLVLVLTPTLVQMQHIESGAFLDGVYSNIREAFLIGIIFVLLY